MSPYSENDGGHDEPPEIRRNAAQPVGGAIRENRREREKQGGAERAEHAESVPPLHTERERAARRGQEEGGRLRIPCEIEHARGARDRPAVEEVLDFDKARP